MPLVSRSRSASYNTTLLEKKAGKAEGNRKWLAGLGAPDGVKLDENGIILIGGSMLADFRVRVAQSAARTDMFPSFWSLCGILLAGGKFVTVPLDLRSREQTRRRDNDDVSAIPKSNAVRMCSLDEYDDPKLYPNIAVIRFAKSHDDAHQHIQRVQTDRTIIDLTAMLLPWLGFIWGTSASTNPLTNGIGLPSAAFVETVFAMGGFELTPGLSSASSCPEAIWQSAKWWMDFYQSTSEGKESVKAVPMTPKGFYTVRQIAAAIEERGLARAASG
jgi:hypothetical protein